MELGNEKSDAKKEKKVLSTKLSRRGFLKTSLGLGVGATGTALFGSELTGGNGVADAADIVQHDTMPVEISTDYQRYSYTRLSPVLTCPGGAKYFGKRMGAIPQTGGPGWTQLEVALDNGSWAIEQDINHYQATLSYQSIGLFSWKGEVNPNWGSDVNPTKYKFESPEAASAIIKKAAMYFGASKVGIAPYDERWVYSEVMDPVAAADPNHPNPNSPIPNKLPFTPSHVIVMILEMDYDGYQTAPALPQTASSANIYSNMGVTSRKLATFIRTLGYQCIPCSNDTALSVPLAIQAGLGELSRIGIMISPEFGPRQRICKTFVDMDLAIDKPISFGAMKFCKTCKKCADACPSQAISHDDEPSFKVKESTNPGVKKWAVDGVKCMTQWGEVGSDCGVCIKVCPYNKPTQEWHHDLAKLATRTPAKPLLRFFDDLFGYGKIIVPDAVKNFWNK
ncbi:reductive dehalogenase [Dehalobacter sp. MCB1]|uniref:reductive dehalogenase n=1 Tax=unclassified Dehalobacter TaxID=2635733 RepID=UPI000E6B890E|nr:MULTISPECIES: reductive dehalogenase [unclassified Dehalobacter]RJE47282.1 reductive dehalogenase [Dehalobacter sp. MCB1]TCX55321.1 reductive dehalogenase [Dehalobacter sp. 12DCB1]